MQKYADVKSCIAGSDDLFKYRITEILLISTEYDAYVLEEDGQLAERIYHQFSGLSIPYIPRLHWCTNQENALEILACTDIHLVISMSRTDDFATFSIEESINELYPDIPIVMLSYDRLTPECIRNIRNTTSINRAFHWAGDSKLLLAIIKYVEDMQNFPTDSKLGVQAILLVEDSPIYYSQILPIIYTEILSQIRHLVLHAMNVKHGLLRVRLRPRILLAETYEEAMTIICSNCFNLLGVIADTSFPKDGKLVEDAGFQLAEEVKWLVKDLPFLLQSDEDSNASKAQELGLQFFNKNDANLLYNLKEYISTSYGFGAFIFRLPDGQVLQQANDITELEQIVRFLPEDSLRFHASNNDFSRWFRARAEFEVADKLRFFDVDKIKQTADVRAYILSVLAGYFQKYQSGSILNFEGLTKKDMDNAFIKLGEGSLGGKARGVAFMNAMLSREHLANKYDDMIIKIPRSFVIGSEIFEEFIESNELIEFLRDEHTDEEIAERFLQASLSSEIKNNLRVLTDNMTCPLAVRSSSLLEDSRILPFAGIYKTYVLRNSADDREQCFNELAEAVKLVYASVFYDAPKKYAKNADIRVEEERMAVLIQELVGEYYGEYFYPTISGVAQSYNFYPYKPSKPEDGVVNLALGFGKTIVEGERAYRFSPAYPKMNPLVASAQEQVSKAQNDFYAINLEGTVGTLNQDDNLIYTKLPVKHAVNDGALEYIGSSYSAQEDCIHDNVNKPGFKFVSFAPILKYERLPLNKAIQELLERGKNAFGSEVEIEFAVKIPKETNSPKELYFLQIRPIVIGRESYQIVLEDRDKGWCYSRQTIGSGVYDNLCDVIIVKSEVFSLNKGMQIASEIGEINKLLAVEGKRCILISFGRIGTSDQWLGVPVRWEQMSQAKVIVEAGLPNLRPEPSLGSHFFHNLTATGMGYFHVPYNDHEQKIDWQWINEQEPLIEKEYVKLIRNKEPYIVKIDGKKFEGIIYKN